jgi:hypothetical protein
MKFDSTLLHFSSIKPIKPGTEVCAVMSRGVTYWIVDNNGKWKQGETFYSLEDFEKEKGKLEKQWVKILLVNGDSIKSYYKDGTNFKDIPYIVVVKKDYYLEPKRKPMVHKNYYIKDEYKTLKNKLPELKGIF